MNNIDSTLEERGNRYGSYVDVSDLTFKLYEIIRIRMEGREGFEPYHIEAIHMICNKIARIVCGDPMYIDSWRDVCGYSELVVKELSLTDGSTDSIIQSVKRIGGDWIND